MNYLFLILVGGVLIICLSVLLHRYQTVLLEKNIHKEESEAMRMKLIEQIKNKIDATTRANTFSHKGMDLVADFIYKKEDISKLGDDFKRVYNKQLSTVRIKYPSLTDLDMLIFSLLGIGLDNYEVCALLGMERRTLYRRRQLMAQRMNMSSLELDEFAQSILNM